MGIGGGNGLTDGWQDKKSRYEAPENEVMQYKQKSRSGEIRTRP